MGRNNRNARRFGNASKRKRSQPSSTSWGIDWEVADRLHSGGKAGPSSERSGRSKVHNEYTRLLTGFSDEFVELLRKYGFKHVREDGSIRVEFSGVSTMPLTELPYQNPSLVQSGGKVILSGLVESDYLAEIGRQVNPPVLRTHNATGRFNVLLGKRVPGLNENLAARELRGSELFLSQVAMINGTEITQEVANWGVDHLWNRRQPEPTRIGLSSWM